MTDLDKRLGEWIASCECVESFHDNCTTANKFAAALLRARKKAQSILDIKCYCYESGYYENLEKCFHTLAKELIEDSELLEALG